MDTLHNKLMNNKGWYASWHRHKANQPVHWAAFVIIGVFFTALVVVNITGFNLKLHSTGIKAAFNCDFYAAPNGIKSGTGDSAGIAWELNYALNKGSALSGKTLCLKGGTYTGKFVSNLVGTTVRSAPGEWAKLDGNVHAPLAVALLTAVANEGAAPVFVGDPAFQDNDPVWIDNDNGLTEGEMIVVRARQVNTPQVGQTTWSNSQRGWGATPISAHAAGANAYDSANVLTINGSNSTFRDIEILDSHPIRKYNFNYNNTTIPIRSGGIIVQNNTGTKLVNLVIHDVSTGVYANESAVGLEIYGDVVYNFGFVDWSRGHGEGFYLANKPAVQKKVRNVVSFNGFNDSMKAYTSSDYAQNFLFEHVIAFNAGVLETIPGNNANNFGNGGIDIPPYYRDSGIFVGANGPNKNTDTILVHDSYFYSPPDTEGVLLRTGYYEGVGSLGLEVTNSRIMGGSNPFAMAYKTFTIAGNTFYAQASGAASNGKLLASARVDSGYSGTWNNNTYYDQTSNDVSQLPFQLSTNGSFRLGCGNSATLQYSETCTTTSTPLQGGWKQVSGFDANSNYYAHTRPTGTEVFVIPNEYEDGRANVAVYNWDKASTVSVDLSNIKLAIGQQFKIVKAENYFGPNQVSGSNGPSTYNGGPMTINMNDSTVTPAIGMTWIPASTCPEFCAFVVLPVSGSVTQQPTPPQITTQPTPNQTLTAGSGQSAIFSVSASGTAPLSYQWKKGTTNISGATSSSYTISVPTTTDSGSYSVVVSNTVGSVTSNAAVLTVNPPVVSDTTPPTLSAGLPAGTLPAGTTSVTLSLTTNEASTCKFGTASGVAYASLPLTFTTTGGTSHSQSISGLTNGISKTYYVRCQDTAGNSNTTDYPISFQIASPTGDTQPPTVPQNLRITVPATQTSVTIAWNQSTDNVAVVGYHLYRNNQPLVTITSPTTLSYQDTTLTAGTTYTYDISAYDAAGNGSAASAALSVTTLPPTPVPSIPPKITSFSVSSKTQTSATITWKTNPATTGSIAYGTVKGSLTQTSTDSQLLTTHSLTISGLTRNKVYYYKITATNTNGSVSSITASFRTRR